MNSSSCAEKPIRRISMPSSRIGVPPACEPLPAHLSDQSSLKRPRASCDQVASIGREMYVPTRPPFFQSCRSEEHTSELQSRGHLVCRLYPYSCCVHPALHSFLHDALPI